MTTLAKNKALAIAALANAPAVLPMTPNARTLTNITEGATIALFEQLTSVVQLIDPPSQLTLQIDAQNFGAFGSRHFVISAATESASTVTVQYVRGRDQTVLASLVVELAAQSNSTVTIGSWIPAEDQVELTLISHASDVQLTAQPATEILRTINALTNNQQFDLRDDHASVVNLTNLGQSIQLIVDPMNFQALGARFLMIEASNPQPSDSSAISLQMPDSLGNEIAHTIVDVPANSTGRFLLSVVTLTPDQPQFVLVSSMIKDIPPVMPI